ncbi:MULTISPECIES: hypothetical protein [unclassified Rathayibacter]|nr:MULTISPECIES: hypothetical protein [unclassified Rathayibacter]
MPSGPNTVQMLQAIRDAWGKTVIFGEGDVKTALDGAAETVTGLAGQQ